MAGRERIQRMRNDQYIYTGKNLIQRERDANAKAARIQNTTNRITGISGGATTQVRQDLARLRNAIIARGGNNRVVFANGMGTRYNSNVRSGDGQIGVTRGVGTTSRFSGRFELSRQPVNSGNGNSPLTYKQRLARLRVPAANTARRGLTAAGRRLAMRGR